MTTLKSLPARPSLESLRKQAKKLSRDIAAGSAVALARVRVQLPDAELPLSQRDAQLVLAREYGFAGWQALIAEVLQRQGKGLDWAAAQAHRAIHDNDVERLKQLLAEYPALLSWRDEGGGLIASATNSYGDSFDPWREQHFTRRACAELLLDAGAIVDPSVWEDAIGSRARGTLQLLWSKGVLPRTLKILVALGDLDGVRACFDGRENELADVDDAFLCACRFENEAIASFLLDQCIALEPDLGQRIDAWSGRPAFIKYMVDHLRGLQGFLTPRGRRIGPWQAFVMHQVMGAINEDELENFSRWLQREPWLLGEPWVGFQEEVFSSGLERPRGIHRSSVRSRSGDSQPASAASIPGNRVCVRVREDSSHSTSDAHLAAARRSAIGSRPGRSRRREALVRHFRQARVGEPRRSFPRQLPAVAP
jgi:hypothetical protein